MFDPINALLASSFSKNGIKAAATDTTCFGETSIKSTFSGFANSNPNDFLQETKSSTKVFSLLNGELAWAIVYLPSSIADK